MYTVSRACGYHWTPANTVVIDGTLYKDINRNRRFDHHSTVALQESNILFQQMDIVTRDCHGGAIFAPLQVGLNVRMFLKYFQPSSVCCQVCTIFIIKEYYYSISQTVKVLLSLKLNGGVYENSFL